MSRSWRHNPIIKDRARTSKDHRKPKTFANRKVRRSADVPGGKAGYKRLYEKWDISDYWFRGEKNIKELQRRYESDLRNPAKYTEATLEEKIRQNKIHFISK